MKLLGAMLLLGSAGLLCRTELAQRRREREALRALAAALESLERGVRVSLAPLPCLMEQCGEGIAGDFFSAVLSRAREEPDVSLPALWRAETHSLPLSPRERECLARPALAFGGEEEDLLRALRDCAAELRISLAERERAAAGESRLIATLSFSLSILFAILLI